MGCYGLYKEKVTVLNIKQSFDLIRKRLISGIPFTYTRYGDGELFLINGWKGKDKNHFNSPSLQKELIEGFSINDNNYLIGVSAGFEKEPGMVDDIFASFSHAKDLTPIINKYHKDKVFLNYVTLHYMAIYYPVELYNLFNTLKSRKVVLIGGKHLNNDHLRKIYGNFKFIETPPKQAYYNIDSFYKNIVKESKESVLILSVGICSKVIQKRLWFDNKVTTIDIGSLNDWFLGLNSRNWIPWAKNNYNNLLL